MNPIHILVILQVLDLLTTVRALSLPGTMEANPIMRRAMELLGTVPALVLIKGAVIGLLYHAQYDIQAWAIYALIALYVLVVGNNARLILNKLKG